MIYKKKDGDKSPMNLENDLYRRIETTKHLDRFFVTGLEDLRIRMKYYEGQ